MKVALVSNFPVYSGTGKVPYELWQNLNREGLVMADFYLTHYLTAEDHQLPEYASVKVLHPFDYRRSPTLSRLFIYFLDPYLLPNGYDLYHFGNHMIANFVRVRRPSVVTVHDVLQFRYAEKMSHPLISKIYNYFMRKSLNHLTQADHLICVSTWSKGELLRRFPSLSESKVSVVYNGLDHRLFKPREKVLARQRLHLPLDQKIILHLGSEIPRKQVPLLLKAFKEIKTVEPKTILLRHGERTPNSSALIKSLALDADVWYRDHSREDELPDYYSAADAVVVTSAEEGFCLPIIEAMACGTPVVTTTMTSLAEIAGGAQAESIGALNVSAVVSSVLKVLRMGPAELEPIRQAGLQNAARFSWAKAAKETFEIYRKVLSNKR